jgi:hypothetical protein
MYPKHKKKKKEKKFLPEETCYRIGNAINTMNYQIYLGDDQHCSTNKKKNEIGSGTSGSRL